MKHHTTKRRIISVQEHPTRVFLSMLGAFALLALLVGGIGAFLTSSGLVDLADVGGQTASSAGRQWLRSYLLISNLLPFAGTAVLALFFVYRRKWWSAAGLDTYPPKNSVPFITFFFVCALPFVGWLAYLNLQVPLPDWMLRNEENTDLLLKGILNMESFPEFVVAFLTVAVTPAIGEELLLRGVIQRRIFRAWFGNPHTAIWMAAILFSAMHLEFAGFAPRLLLGVLLGYAYYWSRSLWVPVGLHLLFNGLQVIVAYASGEFNPDAGVGDTPPWWLGVGSLVLVVYLGIVAQRRFVEEESSDERTEDELLAEKRG